MKDRITTIEQSRRLLELGVPAEKASIVLVGEYGDHAMFKPTTKTILEALTELLSSNGNKLNRQ